MATAIATGGVKLPREAQGGVQLPPSRERIQAKLDLAIALALASWPALTVAVQNSWGGPQSAEKRDWFAGAISDLLHDNPDADVDYMEEFLFHIMNDEFDTFLEDGSAEEVAAKIIGLRKLVFRGDSTKVEEMFSRWQEIQSRGGEKANITQVEREEEEQDSEWDSDDLEEGSEDGDGNDVEMADVSFASKQSSTKVPLEVDADGFTKVTSKKRR